MDRRVGMLWEIERSAEDVAEFRKLWCDGVATREIAARLRMSLSTVWHVSKRLELPRRAATPNGYRARGPWREPW